MSVHQTTEGVALEPAVVTLWVASHVPVTTDSLEMDLLAMVSQLNTVWNHYIFCLIYILHLGMFLLISSVL